MDNLNKFDFSVKFLGKRKIKSPISKMKCLELKKSYYVKDEENKVRFNSHIDDKEKGNEILGFEQAGPRNKIYFHPKTTTAAIVTCGGLCPGLNNVIRGIVMELVYWYGVKKIWGFRYGYSGLAKKPEYPPIKLTPEIVSNIHQLGGTILGSSRGNIDTDEIIHILAKMKIDILFCIGGDGTLRGAHDIAKKIEKYKLNIAVVGIPKTIDNDIPFVYKSFGFQTAVDVANRVLECAHVEAMGAKNGIGIVKLMGREAGFVASHATRANGNVDFCLIPEMKFYLEGKDWIYEKLRKRLERNEHAVIVVSEGAGQHLIGDSGKTDASGNKKFNDIGRYIRFNVAEYFKKQWDMDVNVRYISPSYVIRSVAANGQDSIFCGDLAKYAVDAAMAGKTDMMIGYWHGEFTHVPLSAIIGLKKVIKRKERLWLSVLESTGQPLEWW